MDEARRDFSQRRQSLIYFPDVVPVDPKTIKDWEAEPFAGEIVDYYVYAEALQTQSPPFGILESLETLLSNGWNLKHNLYFCFGQDEEIGGRNGAPVWQQQCAMNKA